MYIANNSVPRFIGRLQMGKEIGISIVFFAWKILRRVATATIMGGRGKAEKLSEFGLSVLSKRLLKNNSTFQIVEK